MAHCPPWLTVPHSPLHVADVSENVKMYPVPIFSPIQKNLMRRKLFLLLFSFLVNIWISQEIIHKLPSKFQRSQVITNQ